MIVGELSDTKIISELKGFESAFQFLLRPDLKTLEPGKYPIEGDDVFAIVAKSPSRSPEEGKFEAHQRYIDVQFLVSGSEMIAACRSDSLTVLEPYDDDRDVVFYAPPERYTRIEMAPGRFAVFFPMDAHLPNLHNPAPCELHKVVVKVSTTRV